MMKIHPLSVGMLDTNAFVVENDRDAVVIDPGDEAHLFEEIINNNKLTLQAILITHGHGDHIGGVQELKASFPKAQIVCHVQEADMLRNPNLNMSAHMGHSLSIPHVDQLVNDQEIIKFGSLEIEVRHVPGHTRGHVVYLIKNHLFAGDTLFSGSIGRWDLPGGNGNLLVASIKEKLLSLPGKTIVYPGHGPETTIARERDTNPFLAQDYNIDALGW